MSKEKFDKKLIKLLESNPNFLDDAGELHRANVRERAGKLDPDLIKLLLTDKEIENRNSLRKSRDVGFSITTPSLTISPIKTSSPTPIPNSVTKSV